MNRNFSNRLKDKAFPWSFAKNGARAWLMAIAMLPALTFGLAMTLAAKPAHASGAAVVVTDLNLRTGPSTRHHVVRVLRGGSPVRVNACTQGPGWCDVTYRGSRGWVSARYLDFGRRTHYRTRDHRPAVVPRSGGVFGGPTVIFRFDYRDDRHYRDRPRYGHRDYRREYRRDYRRQPRHYGHSPRFNRPRYDYRSFNDQQDFHQPRRETRREAPVRRDRQEHTTHRSQPETTTPLLAEPRTLERRSD